MTNEINRGIGQLRDMSPAQGIYEVNYVIHTNTQSSKHIGVKPTAHKVFTADIRLMSGHGLKNGIYNLEQEGISICRLRKTGALWELYAQELKGKENG